MLISSGAALLWKCHGRLLSPSPGSWNRFPLQCSIHRSPAPPPAHQMKAENKKTSRGCRPGNAGPTLAAALDGSQGSQRVKGLRAPPKAAAFRGTGMGDTNCCFYPGVVGALLGAEFLSTHTGSGGDFLHINPSQTRRSPVLVLCLCYYKLPVWQLEQEILSVLLKQ